MIEPIIEIEGLKGDIIKELKILGACDYCTLRYLGVKDPIIYRDKDTVKTVSFTNNNSTYFYKIMYLFRYFKS